ncbi:MAG TPA: MFS transporter [Verrucomicrobiae bacterium]|jgi:OPA family glycerol-3-phosphate transporter-like MFS transporter/OPA family sugar phosphate sensor protein UhpC-like MFS transporter|nr:MFS transporter [Verrucomicrobiae bacterium]
MTPPKPSETASAAVTVKPGSQSSGGFFGIFRPAPPAPVMLSDPVEIAARYRTWQTRVLIFSILGYATFYFVRGNLPVALPLIGSELGITKARLGLFLTLHGVIYGISKFLNGFLADRANPAVFMSTALLASALINICFGFGSSVLVLGLFWVLNGWFQGMGFPPCARLTSNWFPPKQLAAKFSIWNLSHNIGSVGVVLLCGFLVSGSLFAANWRLCFFVPAVIALVIAVVLWLLLPDTPQSVGLPDHEGTHVDLPENESQKDFGAFVRRQVFGNPYIWIFSTANFFVYTIRYAVFNWGPTMLIETRHMQITHAAAMVASFEAFGGLGALLGGWITDRFLGGRAGRACILYMALAGISLLLFWKVQTRSELVMMGLLGATGFFVYGPQCLLAIACMKLATKRAAATAVGLTSIFGYASTTVSGWGLGLLVQTYGWDMGFAVLIACAMIGTLLFIIAWPAEAHGYRRLSDAS